MTKVRDNEVAVGYGRNRDCGDVQPLNVQSYLVRHAPGHQRAGHLVGIFCAASIDDLVDIVDEWFFPQTLEATPLPAGGIYWPGEPDFPIPNRLALDAAEDHVGLPERPSLSAAWDALFYGINPLSEWITLEAGEHHASVDRDTPEMAHPADGAGVSASR